MIMYSDFIPDFNQEGYNSHAPLHWVSQQKPSWSIDFLILLLDILGDLLQNLKK